MADYQWVTHRIAVGAALVATDVPRLEADGVTHVCDVTQHDDSSFLLAIQGHPAIQTLWLNTADDGGSKAQVFSEIPDWFLSAWATKGTKFLFHCDGGVNRGPSACYLALLLLDWPSVSAKVAIRTARPQVGIAYETSANQVAASWQ